jgi:hypothetical protein
MAPKSGPRKKQKITNKTRFDLGKAAFGADWEDYSKTSPPRKIASVASLRERFPFSQSVIYDVIADIESGRATKSDLEEAARRHPNASRSDSAVGKCALLDTALYDWVVQKRAQHAPISQRIVIRKAQQLAESIVEGLERDTAADELESVRDDIEFLKNFKGSNGYIDRFMNRHNLHYGNLTGEAGSADPKAVAEERDRLQRLFSGDLDQLRSDVAKPTSKSSRAPAQARKPAAEKPASKGASVLRALPAPRPKSRRLRCPRSPSSRRLRPWAAIARSSRSGSPRRLIRSPLRLVRHP